MIDYENEIFDACAKAVMEAFPDATVSSVSMAVPASFPAVSISEADSSTDEYRNDSSDGENASYVAYDVVCYSNRRVGRKAEAKELLAAVDDLLTSLNFRRTYRSQANVPGSESVYQVKARYMAGIDKDGKIYRR